MSKGWQIIKKSFSARRNFLVILSALLIIAALYSPAISNLTEKTSNKFIRAIFVGIAGTAEAATADYVCDGTDDNVEVQAAVTALPATGGQVTLLAGTYNFAATVFRTIGNITISGVGDATYVTYNASTAVFSASGQTGWTFANFKTDAGWITTGTNTAFINMNNAGTRTSILNGITISSLDDTPGGVDGLVTKATTSNVMYDHGVATAGVHGVDANYVALAPAASHLVRTFTEGWTSGKLLKGAGVGADPTEVSEGAKIAFGTYTGNDTANRAIAHGLGAIPKIVFILDSTADTSTGDVANFRLMYGVGRIFCFYGGSNSSLSVTAPDATNFYVGNATYYQFSANKSNRPYNWVVLY